MEMVEKRLRYVRPYGPRLGLEHRKEQFNLLIAALSENYPKLGLPRILGYL